MAEKEQAAGRIVKKSLEDTNTPEPLADLVATPNGKPTPSDMPLSPTSANMDAKTWDSLVAKAKALAELTSTLASLPPAGMRFLISPYHPKGVNGPVSLVIMVFDDTYDLGKAVSGTGSIEPTISGRSGIDIMRENATKGKEEQ